MSGVRYGPMEVFVNCDEPLCSAEAMVWAGPVEDYQGAHPEPLPPGWAMRDNGKTFCPKHSDHTEILAW